jgi:hypothetical protein
VGINGVVVTWVVAIRVGNSTRRGFDSLLMHSGILFRIFLKNSQWSPLLFCKAAAVNVSLLLK